MGAGASGNVGRKAVLPLALLTLAWLVLFFGFVAHLSGGPHAHPFGVDFAHNMSSASVMNQGGNPYDSAVLVRGEHTYLQRHGVPNHVGPSDRRYIWGGYPPLFFWLLRPLTPFPFPQVATAWIVALILIMAASFLLYLWARGWSARLVPTLLFLTMPQTTFQAYFANPACLVFAVIMAALAIHRRWPLAAGMLLSLTWLKPQLGLPSVVLIALFDPPGLKRTAAGFTAGTLALLAGTLIGPGPRSLLFWLQGMVAVSGIAGEQPNMIPLVGLYGGWASGTLHTALEALTVAVALGLTGWWWLRLRGMEHVPSSLVAWLWAVWLLALPYAHFPDEILLAPAILAVLGPNGRDMTRPLPGACVYLLYVSTLLYNVELGHVQLLWAPLMTVAILLYRHAAGSLRALGDRSLDVPAPASRYAAG